MKSILNLLLAALTALPSFCQPCPNTFLGSKTLYKTPEISQTPPPAGFLPVFANHVGRHGARHVTSDINSSFVYRFIMEADSAGGLTIVGQQLKSKIVKLEKVEKKHFKSISAEGRLEQQGLADRFYMNNKALFSGSTKINIDYTKEIRTLQTSEAFINELNTKIPAPVVTRQINDTTLRFYDLSPAYLSFKQSGPWLQLLEASKKSVNYSAMADETADKFFKEEWINRRTTAERETFMAGLFGFVTILYSLENEIKEAGFSLAELELESYFSCAQLVVLSKVDNAEDFYQKGPGITSDGIQVMIAAPLLANFISTTDAYLRDKTVPVYLRFSHAETISPFATLLSLETATGTKWQAGDVIPLSANIQWVLYQQAGKKKTLVKVLLNEREMHVKGLTTKTFPYYDWPTLRTFYLQKLTAIHLQPGEGYLNWLKKLEY